MHTEDAIIQLDRYLTENGYYDLETVDNNTNEFIISEWQNYLKVSIEKDFPRKDRLQILFKDSVFHLIDERQQGACMFTQLAEIEDNSFTENLKIIFKSIVNYNKTYVFLDSCYANQKKYEGNSKLLFKLFNTLKSADKISGYFTPLFFRELVL